ncbi:UNVERIFIED_CONTAM: hypothetical protein Sangu_0115100 [Sesamum angustifolium]|uniref:Late embryogenesis abundant protein LEA-2 subgroup domain-containing protein n=1 Tax=Sesamum angustifolium TaxID=2727405 RepID=A0AAW2RM36_9LAMI
MNYNDRDIAEGLQIFRMHEDVGKVLNAACAILVSGFVFFICFCLSFQNHKPKCYITDLFVPALNTYTNSSTTRANTFIFFDLKLENVMPFNGLRYDNVNLTFSYNSGGDRSTLFIPIAQHTVPGFYQGRRKTAHKRDVTNTRGVPWRDAFAAVSNGTPPFWKGLSQAVFFGMPKAEAYVERYCGRRQRRFKGKQRSD